MEVFVDGKSPLLLPPRLRPAGRSPVEATYLLLILDEPLQTPEERSPVAEEPAPARTASGVEIAKVISVPFDENTYVFSLPGRDDCVVFDPGLQPRSIIELLDERSLTPAAILCTHAHTDHIAGNEALKKRWPEAPLVIGRNEAHKLTDPVENLSAMFGFEVISPEADRTVAAGETIEYAGMQWSVLDTPGHSTGHVTFLLEVEGKVHAVSGDVLFKGSVGRTDFPGCDFETLRESIHSQLFPLPGDTIVYPGHGPTTTIDEEKRTNPLVGVPAGWIES